MSVLKYKNAAGEWVAITNYTVQPITPVQTTGSSTSDVMSQNAVTTELNKKANSADVYTKTDANNTFLSQSTASSTYLTKTDASTNYLTKTEANNTYVTETEVNQIVYGSDTKPENPPTVVTTENLTTTLSSYSTTAEMNSAISSAVSSKADKATTLAGYGITDAKIAAGTITLGANTITPLTSHQAVTNNAPTLAWGTTSTVGTVGSTNLTVTMPANPNSDTKNTAGSTDTASKIFLIGATSQAANPQTYSHDTAFVGTDGCLYSNSTKVSVEGHDHTFASLTSKPTTLSGYGITDAKISGGIITLGSNTITPLTSIPSEYVTDSELSSTLSSYATSSSVSSAISEASFNTGHNSVTSITSVPVTKRLVIATISASASLALASIPADGREIHIIVKNSSSSDITVTMPSSSGYVKMSGDTLTVKGSSYADINIISDGTNMYIRAL